MPPSVHGVSIVPLRIVENPLPLPVRQLPLAKPTVYRTLGLLEPSNHDNSLATAALLGELKHLTNSARQGHQIPPAVVRKKPKKTRRRKK